MFKRFKALSTLKKTVIVLVIIAALFILAPLTVKYASAGEIDLYALVMELFTRSDAQDEEIAELKTRVAGLESAAQDLGNGDEGGQTGNGGEGAPPGGSGDDGGSGNSGSTPPSPPPGNGSSGNDGGSSDPPKPDPKPEPEPWPRLAKVDYVLTPQRTDRGRMVYRFEGSVLYCDYYTAIPEKLYYGSIIYDQREEQTEYSFTESIDLAAAWNAWENGGPKPKLKGRLPANVICQVSRSGGTLKVGLLNWIGRDAPYEVRFPSRKVHTIP